MKYGEYIQSLNIFKDDVKNGMIKIYNPVLGDMIALEVKLKTGSQLVFRFYVKELLTSTNYISFKFLDDNLLFNNPYQDRAFSLNVVLGSDLVGTQILEDNLIEGKLKSDLSISDFVKIVNDNYGVSKVLFNQYYLSLPSYFSVYESYESYYYGNDKTYSNYDYMVSWLSYQNNALQETTQQILISLTKKLDTLDNLNILSQVDFSPLLQLSSLSDTLALLNPTITTQNQVTSELNSNVGLLLPVRAKYGEPVTPVSPTTVILSLQGRHKLEITRKSDVNSILTLFEKDGNILGYFFDIDYSRYKNLEKYNQLYLSYDSADYDINLLPIIGYDD